MLKEHTIVYSKEKLDEKIDKGCEGVIVYVYNTDVYEEKSTVFRTIC